MNLREFVAVMGLDKIIDSYRPLSGRELDTQGWLTDTDVLSGLVHALPPAADIIEVGTWKGASAMHMAMEHRYATGRLPTVLCIDTWLGSVEHVTGTYGRYEDIRPFGSSLPLLEQFLCNIATLGLLRHIFPLPSTSVSAAVVLHRHCVQVDMVYVDGAHNYTDVLRDLRQYWPLVRPGGTLVGDDYSAEWSGVVRAADEFGVEIVQKAEIKGRKYIFKKPDMREALLVWDPSLEPEIVQL